MTADEVRLELLAQVIVLGAAVTVARERVSQMTLGEGVALPTMSQCYRMVKAARADGTAKSIRRQWDAAQARRRKDAEGVKRAEAIRLVLNERLSRKEVGERLGVHPWTVTRWLTEPEAMQALHSEARVSAMLGALSLDDDIAWFRRLAAEMEEKEPGLALAARKAAADIEVKRLNGAAKIIVENSVQVAAVASSGGPVQDAMAQTRDVLAQLVEVRPTARAEVTHEEVEGG